jgi:arginyl-tRNA synthetase
MHLFSDYHGRLIAAINALQTAGSLPDGLALHAVALEPPRDPSHGDMASNAAMVLAKQAKQNPRAIAEALAEVLRKDTSVAEVTIAGPGFINLRLAPSVWQQQIARILAEGESYSDSSMGKGEKVNVEYVSANPTGPLHIGHARGAIYGDALADLLIKAGYDVCKEYYVNDAGAQIEVLARSAFLRYREACGEAIGDIPDGLYPGDYLKAAGEAIKAQVGDRLLPFGFEEIPKAERDEVCDIAINAMMGLIREDLAMLGIRHDVFTSEARLRADKKVEAAIARLTQAGHVYRGTLPPPKGETPEDWEPEEQLLFRSSAFGDDSDRTIQKANGAYTYFSGDLALTCDKIDRGFYNLIYMFGADHGGYVKRMEASAKALSDGKAEVDIKLCQLVHLFKNGEPVRMSKRAGNFVMVRDVVNEVGKDILRFVMLMRKTNQDMEFDLEKVKEQSKDNPVFYVQYAHARVHSLLRMASEQTPDQLSASQQPNAEHLAHIRHPDELALIRLLASYPRVIEQAAAAHEPHRIIYYAQEVASAFHGVWHLGQGNPDMRFIVPNSPQLTIARLALARAVANIVASTLKLCGVTPLEEL